MKVQCAVCGNWFNQGDPGIHINVQTMEDWICTNCFNKAIEESHQEEVENERL